jgi:hypothetical protein
MQNKACIVAAIVLLSTFGNAQVTAGAPETPAPAKMDSVLKLADATPVLLRTKQSLSSATAKVGDRVPFRVTEDVNVGDLIVIHRGAEAWGVVTAVKQKARKGLAGTLDVSILSTQLLTGDPVLLRAEQHLKGVGRSVNYDTAEALGESAGLALPFIPLIRMEKGKDVSLDADTKVTAYLNGDVALDPAALERAQPPLAHRTGPATVIVFRPSLSWGSLNSPSLFCGKITLTRLWNGRYLKMQLPPGKYSLESSDNQVLELHLEQGQEIYVQMQMLAKGMSMKGHMVLVLSGEGEDEVAHLRQMDAKEVIKVSDANLADLQALPEKKKH